jgi:hypothetical protein
MTAYRVTRSILPFTVYAVTIAFIAAWFFATRWVLRKGFLERLTHITEWLYSMQLNRMHKKYEKRHKRDKEYQ